MDLPADKDTVMMITLYRTDKRGATHYYSVHDRQGHLFSSFTFTTSWGRNVSVSREKVYQFETQNEMDAKVRSILQGKFKSGYRVLYSYFRPNELEKKPELKRYSAG